MTAQTLYIHSNSKNVLLGGQITPFSALLTCLRPIMLTKRSICVDQILKYSKGCITTIISQFIASNDRTNSLHAFKFEKMYFFGVF